MKRIDEIDANFKNKSAVRDDMVLYNVREKPFKLYGFCNSEEGFCRLPKSVAENTNYGVSCLATNTAGGRVRFKTDSEYIIVKAVMPNISFMPHMAVAGSSGFDMYVSGEFVSLFFPQPIYKDGVGSFDTGGGYEAIKAFETREMRDIIINFPLYNDVTDVFIGLNRDAVVLEGDSYKDIKPVVYYGSSITQGGCASRPGNSYEALISRWLDVDYINLGFSGSAMAEDAIADYIASLEMSAFVYDYDHNAPNAEHLKKTHYKMFKKIRDKNPELPIIMVTAPYKTGCWEDRFDIIKGNYDKAIADGDKNVYFVSGHEMCELYDSSIFAVDGTHPNDFGFYCMAKVIGGVLEKLL